MANIRHARTIVPADDPVAEAAGDLLPSDFVAAHTVELATSDVTGLDSALTGKAAASHSHAGEDITSGTVADGRVASSIARDTEVSGAVSTHEAAGDPHPGYLTPTQGNAAYDAIGAATTAGSTAASALSGHASDSTAVHGITDTASLVLTGDARLSDARTPVDHATSHSAAGSDEVNVTNLAGFPGGSTDFLRADATFAAPPGGGGGISTPTLLYRFTALNPGSNTFTIPGAPVTGSRIVLALDASNATVSSIASTNTTWTRMGSEYTNAQGARLSIWVGVVSGTGGTSIVVTTSAGFLTGTGVVIADALTPTVGDQVTANIVVESQVLDPMNTTAGDLVVFMFGLTNTTERALITAGMPCVYYGLVGVGIALGYAPSGDVSANFRAVGAAGVMGVTIS